MDDFASFIFEDELVVNGGSFPGAFGDATILEDVSSSLAGSVDDFMIAIGGAVFLDNHSNDD